MLYTLKSYIKFILKSTNEHGVHSPFVYSLLTKCIYNKQHKDTKKHLISKKKQIIPYKIASYFKSNEILVVGNSKNTASLLSLARPNSSVTVVEDFLETQTVNKHFDLIYVDSTNSNINIVTLFEKLLYSAQKNCVFIFEGIYTNTANTKVWHHMIASQDVTVSIDGFYCGLIFLKKGQEKQHFTLRL